MLAGNTPVYSGTSNDEFLHLRLSDMPGYPITLQDLKELSEVRLLRNNVFIYEQKHKTFTLSAMACHK